MLSPLVWAAVIRYPFFSFYLRVDKFFSFALNTFQYLLCVEHWQCVGDIILLFLWRQTANTCHIVWGHKCWLRNQFGYWNFSETFISLLPSIWEPIYLLDFIFFLLEDNRQNFLWGHTALTCSSRIVLEVCKVNLDTYCRGRWGQWYSPKVVGKNPTRNNSRVFLLNLQTTM